MPRGRIHVGEDVEIDPFRLDLTVGEGAHDLVIAAGEGELEVGQERFPLVPVCIDDMFDAESINDTVRRELRRRSRSRRGSPRVFRFRLGRFGPLGTSGCQAARTTLSTGERKRRVLRVSKSRPPGGANETHSVRRAVRDDAGDGWGG